MGAWAKDQKIEGSNISFIADPNSLVTKALGMELTAPGPCAKLGPQRCKRFAMYVDDGIVKVINVSEAPDDPAGDDRPESSASITCSRISPRCKGNDDAVRAPTTRSRRRRARTTPSAQTVEFVRLAARSMSARRRPTRPRVGDDE